MKLTRSNQKLASNVLCYECDSQSDPNCADPFDLSPEATLQPNTGSTNSSQIKPDYNTRQQQQQQQQHQQASFISPYSTNINIETSIAATKPNDTNSSIISHRRQKKLPNVAICHGCCVKITSKMPDGGKYTPISKVSHSTDYQYKLLI